MRRALVPDGGAADQPRERIITANGNSDFLAQVRELVAVAPAIEGRSFIAFRPANGFVFTTEQRGIRVDPKDLWFLPLDSDEPSPRLGVCIGIPAFDLSYEADLRFCCWNLLEGALGELTVQREIHHLETEALPEDPAAQGFIELVGLATYIEWRNRRVEHS